MQPRAAARAGVAAGPPSELPAKTDPGLCPTHARHVALPSLPSRPSRPFLPLPVPPRLCRLPSRSQPDIAVMDQHCNEFSSNSNKKGKQQQTNGRTKYTQISSLPALFFFSMAHLVLQFISISRSFLWETDLISGVISERIRPVRAVVFYP